MRIPFSLAMVPVALLAGCAELHVTEKQFIRPDKPDAVPVRQTDPAGATALSIVRPDGAVLNGVLFEQAGARATVLYFGGNLFHIDPGLSSVLAELRPCGLNVAVFDYRGYGRSTGSPTVANMQGDALAIFDTLDARFPGRVIVHGHSLGSFMAAHVAASRPVLATVLETTATSPAELVQAQMPWYAAPFVRVDMQPTLAGIDNRNAAARFRSPTLVIAAGKDETTPASLGRKVFDAVPRGDKQFLMLPDAGHNDALGATQAVDAYCRFVRGA